MQIRPATADDLDEMLALAESTFRGSRLPYTKEVWSWKHEANPFGQSPTLLMLDDDRIVGLRTFLRWQWRSGARTLSAVRAVDTATASDYRGRGIFSSLTRALLTATEAEGVDFVFNTPNPKSRAGYLKMGWVDVMRLPLWLTPGRPWATVASSGHEMERASDRLKHILRDPSFASWLDDRMSEDRGIPLRTPLDAHFLTWRYLHVPGLLYGGEWAAGEHGAFIVYEVNQRGRWVEGRVVELVVGPGQRAIRSAARLLRRLRRRLPVHALSAICRVDTREALALALGGFMPVGRRGPQMTVRLLRDVPAPDPRRASSWSCSAGDMELF